MSSMQMNILIVDDENDYCDVIKMILSSKGYVASTCNDGESALNLLKEKPFDIVVTDICMPGMDGNELLKKIKEQNIDVDVIVMTAYGTIEKAVQTMKEGAYSYVTKGSDPEELLIEICKIGEKKKIFNDNKILREKISSRGYMLESKNEKFKQILALAERAAQSDANILILGHSGAGKEILASYIHDMSNRKNQNFMELNCQALSESILESELFGHEKGAFTGAAQKRIGLFEASDQGTLFLDEIGGVSMNLQAKLLKAIENKQIYRMGSNVALNVDFRLITATNRDLQKDMEGNKFRSDLFYRISTIVLELPSLNERREDIPLFLEFFFEKYQREMKKKITLIDPKVEKFLREYTYPGNIRELKNIVERLLVLSANSEIKYEYLPSDVLNREEKENSKILQSEIETHIFAEKSEISLKEYRNSFEKEYIISLVQKYPKDMNKVADILNITRRQLFNKLVEFGIK